MNFDVQPIILAAGKGKRFVGYDGPKVLAEFRSKPMLEYILTTLGKTSFGKPIVVVGHHAQTVKKFLQTRALAVEQPDQLGTAHAVEAALPAISAETSTLLVLTGDMPFWRAATLEKLVHTHAQMGAKATVTTVSFNNPDFFAYGRIIRDQAGTLQKIVEQPMATPRERAVTECNASLYAFERSWLADNIKKIKQNVQGEYYLTDIVEIARSQQASIATLTVENWREALGINTPAQLAYVEKVIPFDWFT